MSRALVEKCHWRSYLFVDVLSELSKLERSSRSLHQVFILSVSDFENLVELGGWSHLSGVHGKSEIFLHEVRHESTSVSSRGWNVLHYSRDRVVGIRWPATTRRSVDDRRENLLIEPVIWIIGLLLRLLPLGLLRGVLPYSWLRRWPPLKFREPNCCRSSPLAQLQRLHSEWCSFPSPTLPCQSKQLQRNGKTKTKTNL